MLPTGFKLEDDSFSIKHVQGKLETIKTEIKGVDNRVVVENPECFFDKKMDKPTFLQNKFEGFCKKIENENLKKIITFLLKGKEYDQLGENRLITLDPKDFGITIPKDQFVDLISCLTDPELQPILLIDYFDRNLSQLDDPDFQTLFKLLIFEKCALRGELKQNPDFAKKLEAFVNRGLAHAKDFENIQSALFFINISRHFKASQIDPRASFLDDQKEIKALESWKMSLDEKALFYHEWAASFVSIDPQSMDTKMCQDFLYARMYSQMHPLSEKLEDPKLIKEANTAAFQCAGRIQQILNHDGSELLTDLFHKLGNTGVQGPWRCIQFPKWVSSDGSCIVNVLDSTFSIKGNTSVTIPSRMTSHPDFKHLFGDKPITGIALNESAYQFNNAEGRLCRVIDKGAKKIIIQMEVEDGIWMQFVPKSMLERDDKGTSRLIPLIGSRGLIEYYDHWISINSPGELWIVSPPKSTPDFRAKCVSQMSAEGAAVSISDITPVKRSDLKLVDLLSIEKNKELAFLTQFEDATYINAFAKDGKIQEIHMPRFGLHFDIDRKDGFKVTCREIRDFKIAPKQILPDLSPFKHFLILENSKGEKRVLIPNQELIINVSVDGKTAAGSLVKDVRFDQKLKQDGVTQTYRLYQIDPETDRLKTRKVEDALFLGLISLGSHHYLACLQTLVTHSSSYSIDEKKIIFEMMAHAKKNQDYFPEAIATRLHVAHLLLHNETLYGSREDEALNELEKQAFSALKEDYNLYLTQRHNVGSFALSASQELEILNELLKGSSDSDTSDLLLKDRKSELTGDLPIKFYKGDVEPDKMPKFTDVEVAAAFALFSPAGYYSYSYGTPEKPLLETRPNLEFAKEFKDKYLLAKSVKDSPEKLTLKTQVQFLKNHPISELNIMGWILEQVLKSPEKFPEWDAQIASYEVERKLLTPIYKITEDLVKKSSSEIPVESSFHLRERDVAPSSKTALDEATPLIRSSTLVDPDFNKILTEFFDPQKGAVAAVVDAEALKSTIEIPESASKVLKSETERLQDDIDFYLTHKNIPQEYALSKIDSLTDLIANCKQKKDFSSDKAEGILQKLMLLVNKLPDEPEDVPKAALSVIGKVRRTFTSDDLLVQFTKQNMRFFQNGNNALTDQDLILLNTGIQEYLISKTEAQQWGRAQKNAEKIQDLDRNSPTYEEEVKELTQDVLANLKSSRCYSPVDHPQYLVLEYYADILMRKDQVDKLDLFLNNEIDFPVLQMIMGSGKSKVLLPILALMRANDSTLSMIVVPDPLFKQTSEDMRITAGGAFGQVVSTLDFERNTEITTEVLQRVLSLLKSTKDQRNCLCMTSKSVQSLFLKYIELRHQLSIQGASVRSDFNEQLKLFKEIVKFFKEYAEPIVDEADLVLNCRHEINFTFGTPHALDKERENVVLDLYNIISDNPRIQANIQPFTDEVYQKDVKPEILSSLMSMWEDKDHFLMPFMQSLTPEGREHLEAYLRGDKQEIPFVDTLSDSKMRDLMALVKEELNTLLPLTLKKNHEEHYGLSGKPGESIAIPYSASNTPNFGSQFGNSYEIMNYTIQTYLKQGFSEEIVSTLIKTLEESAMKEMKQGVPKEETLAYQQFYGLIGSGSAIQLFRRDKEDIRKIVDKINSSNVSKLYFIKQFILPAIQMYDLKISSNPQNFVSLFKKVQGFTGTLWNEKSFHQALKPVPEEGTDARTIATLVANSKDRVFTTKAMTAQELVKEVFAKNPELSDALALIDTGGAFKGLDNLSVAKSILDTARPEIKGVVFYDKGVISILERDTREVKPLSESRLTEKERITFYDQSHTTGSDIPQSVLAKAVVTLGNSTFLRDLLQSVWRMRRLEKGQKIDFLIPEDVRQLIYISSGKNEKVPLDLSDILKFCIQNQAKQQGQDNFLSMKQKMRNVIQDAVLEIILDDTIPPDTQDRYFKAAQKLFFQSTKDEPYLTFGKPEVEVDAAEAVKIEQKQMKDNFKSLALEIPELALKQSVINAEIDSIADKILDALPEKILVPTSDEYGKEVEVEKEQEQETKKELEEQQKTEKPKIKIEQIETWTKYKNDVQILSDKHFIVKPLSEIKKMEFTEFEMATETLIQRHVPMFSLNEGIADSQDLAKYKNVFSEDLIASPNVFFISMSGKVVSAAAYSPEPTRPFDSYQKNSKVLCITFNNVSQKFQLLLIDQYEAKTLKQANLFNRNTQVCLYNHQLGIIQNDQKNPIPEELIKNDPHLKRLLVESKFFGGELNYSKEELQILSKWIDEKGLDLMQELFEDHIIKERQTTRLHYESSPIKQLFERLRADLPGVATT